jgi:hypothetical protein
MSSISSRHTREADQVVGDATGLALFPGGQRLRTLCERRSQAVHSNNSVSLYFHILTGIQC